MAETNLRTQVGGIQEDNLQLRVHFLDGEPNPAPDITVGCRAVGTQESQEQTERATVLPPNHSTRALGDGHRYDGVHQGVASFDVSPGDWRGGGIRPSILHSDTVPSAAFQTTDHASTKRGSAGERRTDFDSTI